MLHGSCVGEEAGERNLVFLRVKWLQPAMKGTLCAAGAAALSFHRRIGSPLVFCNVWLFMCTSSMRFLNLWLQIALEWLRDCCHLVFPLVVMAASRLLGAAAACVILLSFAVGHCKSYWSGCIKAAIMICQQIFSILALVIFPSNSFSKVLQNRVFFFGAEIGFWTCTFSHRCVVLVRFAIQYLDIAL